MKIFLLLDPPTVTAQQKKIGVVRGKPFIYTPENVKEAKDELIKHLRPFKPKEAFVGPIKLEVKWFFPKGTKHKHREWRITRPDTDNLEKLLKDCMTELKFWNDDAQVVDERAMKVWSDEPTGISIEIEILDKFMKEEL